MPNEVSANQVLANKVLANKGLATEVLAPPPEAALSEPDYRAFCVALEASARGRAFLAEYARRNRHADTETVLAALDRLETLVRSQSATARTPPALPPEVAALVMVDKGLAVEAARAHLAVVPRADEPELPIPAPAGGPAPAIALVQKHAIAQPAQDDITQRSAAIIPQINLFDGAPAKPAAAEPAVAEAVVVETVVSEIAATPLPAAFELTLPPPAVKTPATPPTDPLAHIMALSDEERLALFS